MQFLDNYKTLNKKNYPWVERPVNSNENDLGPELELRSVSCNRTKGEKKKKVHTDQSPN